MDNNNNNNNAPLEGSSYRLNRIGADNERTLRTWNLKLSIIVIIILLLGQVILGAVWVTNVNRDLDDRPTKTEVQKDRDERLKTLESKVDAIYNYILTGKTDPLNQKNKNN